MIMSSAEAFGLHKNLGAVVTTYTGAVYRYEQTGWVRLETDTDGWKIHPGTTYEEAIVVNEGW